MNVITDNKCPVCGAEMKQTGANGNRVIYHCIYCGTDGYIEISSDENVEYWQKRADILERVRVGVFEWKTAPWDYIRHDVINFMGRYEDASVDVRMKMALIASMTSGFHMVDSTQYKECKAIFKITEKVYKTQMKELQRAMREFPKDGDVAAYQEYRVLYKKCRDEYRNTKFAWKAGFFILKKIFFFLPS